MPSRIFFLSILMAFCLYLPLSAHAELPDITVDVSETGTNATEAKSRGLNRAQQTAFYQLLQQVAKGRELELAKRTPPQQVPHFISRFDILEERSLATTYTAKIRYSFNEKAVRKLMSDAEGLAPEITGNAILVIPLYDDGTGVMLWEGGNRWRSIFNKAALEKGGDDLLVPYGDKKDMLLLDTKNVFTKEKDIFVKMAERYGAKNIVLVLAHLVEQEQGPATLEIILRRATADKSEDTHIHFKPEGEEDSEALLRRAANKIALQLASSAETFALDYSPDQKLKAQVIRVEFAYPGQWLKLKQALENLAGMEYSAIGAAGPNFTQMILYYRGPQSALQQTIAAKGLSVQADKEFWVVTLPAGTR